MSRRRKPISCRRRWIRNMLLFLGGMLIPIVLCSTAVFECYRVDGDGMAPTLRTGDRAIALTLPHSADRLPSRGSVVVFSPPPQSREKGGLLVKRLCGLPGDTLEVRKRRLWRNGKLADEPYLAEAMDYEWGPVTAPEGSLIVLGDNRNQSDDSHNWPGMSGADGGSNAPFLQAENLRGRVIGVIWPLHRAGRLREG